MKNGVYQIRNLTDGKRYIGSAAERRGIPQRWSVHQAQLKRQRHHSSYLQNAWEKYGADKFVFEVLLYCDPVDCVMYEQIAIDHYKPEYNILPNAGNCLGRLVTLQTKKRLSNALRGNQNWLGKNHSKATRKKMSQAQSGENNPMAKLTEDDVREIKRLLHHHITQDKIAHQFGITRTTVSHIKNGRYWSWV